MKSLWYAHYHGNDVHRFLKKLEHRLGAPVEAPRHQLSSANASDFMVQFYLEHPPTEWKDALFHLLVIAQRLSPGITFSGDIRDMVVGSPVLADHPPVKGLVGCSWRFHASQDYVACEFTSRQSAA